MKTSELVKLIDPKLSQSYSPNLHKYVKRFAKEMRDHRFPDVYQDCKKEGLFAGCLYIGYMDTQEGPNGFVGARLNRVLVNGSSVYGRERGWFIGLGPDNMTHIADFWDRYLQIGRCAIDTNHTQWFIGDNGRYVMNGDIRTCTWCGAKHKRRIEIKTYTKEIEHFDLVETGD